MAWIACEPALAIDCGAISEMNDKVDSIFRCGQVAQAECACSTPEPQAFTHNSEAAPTRKGCLATFEDNSVANFESLRASDEF